MLRNIHFIIYLFILFIAFKLKQLIYWTCLQILTYHKKYKENTLYIIIYTTIRTKVNESRYTALFVVSGSIKKFFRIDFANIYLRQRRQLGCVTLNGNLAVSGWMGLAYDR